MQGRRPASSRLARRRRTLLGAGIAAALLSAGGLIGATFVKSPAQLAADTAAPPDTPTTAKVISQVLTSSVAMRGEVYPSAQYDITPTGSEGPLYVTKLNLSAGSEVTNGDLLAEFDGQPMFVLKGAIPAWRTLSPGESGPDVAELQDALNLLGYYGEGDKPGFFGAATKDAVAAFYQHLGYPVPTTGDGTKQAVDTAAKAVAADQQNLGKLESGKHASRGQLTAARKQLFADESALSSAQAADGPEVPQSQVVFLPTVPSTVVAVNGGVGRAPGSPFLELSARGSLTLTGELPPSDASQVKPGLTVTIYDEVTGIHATGKVASVGRPTTNVPTGTTVSIGGSSSGPPGGESSQPGSANSQGSGSSASDSLFAPVNITPSAPLPASLNGENVLVTVDTGQTAGPVLTVPVAAIVTTASGRSSVTVVTGTQRRTVSVRPGMSANGYVQVTPLTQGALAAGDNVLVSG